MNRRRASVLDVRILGTLWRGTAFAGRWLSSRWARLPARARVPLAVAVPAVLALFAAFCLGTGQAWIAVAWQGNAGTAGSVANSSSAAAGNGAALEAKLDRMVPTKPFLVVDSVHNRLYLWQDRRVVHEALCSAGSGVVLTDGPTGRKWVFDTPRGRFTIRKKVKDPVWTKPDWAFIEEGQRPPRRAADRIERGVLGEYAMHLGDGYMIHGTLYERLLGRSVTHGCIRLGRDDLRRVWEAVEVGTPVYIF